MNTDIKSANVTATGDVTTFRTRVRAISWKPAIGKIVLKDSSTGATLLTIDTDAASTTYLNLPGNGILFTTNVHATLTTVASLTVFYG